MWNLLDRNGEPVTHIPRPLGAAPDNGDPGTPWRQNPVDHLHIWEDRRITGIHARGDIEEVRTLLRHCLSHEEKIVACWRRGQDPAISDVKRLLEDAMSLGW